MSQSSSQPHLYRRLVEEDLAAVMRQGIKAFTYKDLVALPEFAILHAVKPGQEHRTDAEMYLSPNRLRHHIMAFLSESDTVERLVGTALFGADPYTTDLSFTARQAEAGRRYSPGRPVGAGGIRKKPYGQMWKILHKLAECLIVLEAASGHDEEKDHSWDSASSRPQWPRPRPPIPYSHLWEDRAGYRWLDYRAHLTCSPDYSQISVTTTVHIEVLHPGVRTYFHTFEPLSQRHPHAGASAPIVDFPATSHPAAPAVFVGRVGASPRHPTWLLDYFDLGIGSQYEEVLHIAFRHTYTNPTRYRPWTVPVFVEFDNMDMLWISASCYENDSPSPIFYSLQEPHPVAGADYHLDIPRSAGGSGPFLRDPDDLGKTQELERRSHDLLTQVEELQAEHESYFEYPDTDRP